MSFKQNVGQNLQVFAKNIGLGELQLNEHDACGLCFDDTLVVNMEYLEDDEALVFVASVKPVDAHDNSKADSFERMLALNLQHHSMQGAFLALNHDKTEVLLIRSGQASMDYGSFENTLEKFVNTLEWMISELDSASQDSTNKAASASKPAAGPRAGDMGMMV